jgi:hypothetical protein
MDQFMRTTVVRIRLNAATYLKYEKAARLNQMPLSTFIRAKLEEAENTISEISALKSAICDLRLNGIESDTAKKPASDWETEAKAVSDAVLTEIVLLLRGLVRPEHVNMVHAELRRLDLNVFSTVDGGV